MLAMIGGETLHQAVRNLVAHLGPRAFRNALLLRLMARGWKMRQILAALSELESERALSLDPSGFYLLGAPARTAEALTLTSTDPSFGQPALFGRELL